jgi:glyoxylase-like metal-dependent hydrolase (beta-lactamase superfamily II)
VGSYDTSNTVATRASVASGNRLSRPLALAQHVVGHLHAAHGQWWEAALDAYLRHDLSRLDAVVLTHEHADAMGGLDSLRDFTNNWGKRDRSLQVRAARRPPRAPTPPPPLDLVLACHLGGHFRCFAPSGRTTLSRAHSLT